MDDYDATVEDNQTFLLLFEGDADADQGRGRHRVVVTLLQSTVLRRAKILPSRSKSGHLFRVVRLVDRGSQLPTNRRVREGFDFVQRSRSVHSIGREAGSSVHARLGPGDRRVPASRRYLSLHTRKLYQRTEYGSWAGHARDARSTDAGNDAFVAVARASNSPQTERLRSKESGVSGWGNTVGARSDARLVLLSFQAQARECLFEKLELQSKDGRNIDVSLDLAQEASQVAADKILRTRKSNTPIFRLDPANHFTQWRTIVDCLGCGRLQRCPRVDFARTGPRLRTGNLDIVDLGKTGTPPGSRAQAPRTWIVR